MRAIAIVIAIAIAIAIAFPHARAIERAPPPHRRHHTAAAAPRVGESALHDAVPSHHARCAVRARTCAHERRRLRDFTDRDRDRTRARSSELRRRRRRRCHRSRRARGGGSRRNATACCDITSGVRRGRARACTRATASWNHTAGSLDRAGARSSERRCRRGRGHRRGRRACGGSRRYVTA